MSGGLRLRLWLLADAAAPHTRRWALWFARRGHDVHVVTFNPAALPGYGAVAVHRIWTPRFGNRPFERLWKAPLLLARIARLRRQFPPDVAHAHSVGGYAWLTDAARLEPFAATPWGTDLLHDIRESRFNRWLTTRALRRAALVTTDGFHFLTILGQLGVRRDRILLHMFGTDVSHYSPGADEGERARLGAGDAPIVISTRTPNPVHDVETFVRAVPGVLARFPRAVFVIVGDGAQKLELQSLVGTLGVTRSVRFTGMVEEDRMRTLLRAADVYVSTSLMDAGLAGSTAEAMATGLPVVQTDNSDNARWAPEGEGSLLVPNSNPGAVTDAICRLLGDADLRAAMGRRNRAIVEERYNMDTELARVESAYMELASGAGAR